MSRSALMYSGRRVSLVAPRPEDFRATDIAVHLSRIPMYGGATWGFMGYSVAQHCTFVAQQVAEKMGVRAALYALLHHAPVAFGILGEPPEHFMVALFEAFGLDLPMNDMAHVALTQAHDCVEMMERRQLLKDQDAEIARLIKRGARPLPGVIKPVPSDRAKARFLDALHVNAFAARLPIKSMPVMEGI